MGRIRGLVAGIAFVFAVGAAFAPPASAETTSEFHVTITSSDASMPFAYSGEGVYPFVGRYCTGDPLVGTFRYYQVWTLRVSQTGPYTYRDLRGSGIDLKIGVFPDAAFDPANPTLGCRQMWDDAVGINLDSSVTYTLVVTTYRNETTGPGAFTLAGNGTATLTSSSPSTGTDLSIWQQAYGRGSAEEVCDDGWVPSWMQWPNGGQGGWVCVKDIYAYAPGVPVPTS